MPQHDVIIIGAGPAGLTAGLYAGRYRLKTQMLEKLSPGGQIMLSSDIENYPGFPGGIATFDLIDKFKKQVEDVGVEIQSQEVVEIVPSIIHGLGYHIKCQDQTYETRAVIIASGAQPKRLGIEGEELLTGKGVSYCGTCDGPLFKEREVAVIGGGDRALEDALYLTSYAGKVTLIHRRKEFRGSKILEEKVRKNPKIHLMLDSVVEKIEGQQKVESIRIKNVISGHASSLVCQGVFVFVGIIPNTGFIKNLLKLNEAGFIVTAANLKTSSAGIFACGDCIEKSLYQVVNACGEGALAADSVHKYLLGLK